jgi:hypothetical protein
MIAADGDERVHFARQVSRHRGRQPAADLFSA